MFRSSTVIREPALNLAKVIFMLKHSVKLFYIIMWLCGSMLQHAAETCRSDIYVYCNVNFNVFFKLIKVHLLMRELYIYVIL